MMMACGINRVVGNFRNLIKSVSYTECRNDKCPICYEFMYSCDMVKCNTCKNTYDYVCIERWLSMNESCPLCRDKWKY
jgi:hypothetical protein